MSSLGTYKYDDEVWAAQAVNYLCDKLRIRRLNASEGSRSPVVIKIKESLRENFSARDIPQILLHSETFEFKKLLIKNC